MESVPVELERITEEVQDAINDYDLIEEFYYPLSQEDFNVRWEAVFWPGKLEKQLDSTADMLNEIEEDLKKIQNKDANEFQEMFNNFIGKFYGYLLIKSVCGNFLTNKIQKHICISKLQIF